MKARMETMRTSARRCRPFNAFLLLQGIETLHLRMERHCANAPAVAELPAPATRGRLGQLPGPAGQPVRATGRALPAARRRRGPDVRRQGRPRGRRAVHRGVQFCSHLANVGDAKTLVIHPASTTHRQLEDEQLAAAG